VESSGKEKPKLSDSVDSSIGPMGSAAKKRIKKSFTQGKKGLAPFGANPFLMANKQL